MACFSWFTFIMLVPFCHADRIDQTSCASPPASNASALLQARSKALDTSIAGAEDWAVDDSLPLRTDDVISLQQIDHKAFVGVWGVYGGEVDNRGAGCENAKHGIYGYTSTSHRTAWTVEVSGDDVYLKQKDHGYLGFCGSSGSVCSKDKSWVFSFAAKSSETKLKVEEIAGSKNVYIRHASTNLFLGMCGTETRDGSNAAYNVYGWANADASLLQSQAVQPSVRTHFEIQFISRTATTTTTPIPTTIAPTAAPPSAAAAPAGARVNPSGAAAPLDETGYAAVADRCCQAEMKQFIERVVFDQGMEVCDVAGLEGIVPYHSCEQGVQTFAALTANILKDSDERCTWVATAGACKVRPADCPAFSGLSPLADCGCSRSKAATVTLTDASVTQNNLQGLGPTTGAQELRYSNVGMTDAGVPFDIVVTVVSTAAYSRTVNKGFLSGFGVLNFQNSATVKTVEFRFTFVQPGTNTPVVVPEIHFATFDLDGDNPHGIETVSSKGYKGYVTDITPSVVASNLPDGRTKFSSSEAVNNIPNPSDPNVLTVEQRANSVMYFFKDASTFDIEFGIEGGQNSRNLFFSFASVLNDRCGA